MLSPFLGEYPSAAFRDISVYMSNYEMLDILLASLIAEKKAAKAVSVSEAMPENGKFCGSLQMFIYSIRSL